jgi:glutamate racemase
VVGVIGTPATVNSNAYARAINRYDPEIRVFSQACPLFVPLVEEGWLDHPVTRLTAQEYLKPVIAEHIDTLVLGCTHYPLLKPLLQEILGEGIRLVDSAEAMAAVTANLLSEKGLTNPVRLPPQYRFYVTDVPYRFQTVGERFLGRTLANVEVVKLQ